MAHISDRVVNFQFLGYLIDNSEEFVHSLLL